MVTAAAWTGVGSCEDLFVVWQEQIRKRKRAVYTFIANDKPVQFTCQCILYDDPARAPCAYNAWFQFIIY